MARIPYKMKGYRYPGESPMRNEAKVFGEKKSESTATADSLQKVTNDIVIDNAPNPNREAEYKASEQKMIAAGNTVTANRKYNASRGKYIKKTHEILGSGTGHGGTIYQTPSNKSLKGNIRYGGQAGKI